jgi:hypothetical protein
VALEVMTLVKKNSTFDALNIMLNVVLNVPVIPLFYRKFCSTLKAWTNSVLVIPTSKVLRSSARRDASLTPPLELTMRPTARTLSTSLALVSLSEP